MKHYDIKGQHQLFYEPHEKMLIVHEEDSMVNIVVLVCIINV